VSFIGKARKNDMKTTLRFQINGGGVEENEKSTGEGRRLFGT